MGDSIQASDGHRKNERLMSRAMREGASRRKNNSIMLCLLKVSNAINTETSRNSNKLAQVPYDFSKAFFYRLLAVSVQPIDSERANPSHSS